MSTNCEKPVPASLNPVSVYLSERWYNRRIGMDYSEAFWADPIQRTEFRRDADRELYRIFGDVGMGSRDPAPCPLASDAYGHRFMSALFGCEIKYARDQSPSAIALNVDFDGMRNLKVPDFEKSDVIIKALKDAEQLKGKYGLCLGDINTGSPLNVAVSVFGTVFMEACILEPETAQHVLMVIAQTEFMLYHELMAVIQPERFPRRDISLGFGNCPAVMFSPALYRQVILPVDKWFRSQVGYFPLHHCGVFDKYIGIYTELTPDTLDIGGGSDYKAIRKAFPELPFSLIINTPFVEGKSESDIDALVGGIVEAAGPASRISGLWCSDISEQTNDNTIRALRTANERINL